MHAKFSRSIESALREGQFEVYYQPQFSTVSQSIAGFEALVRWHHPELGVLLPSKFLPVLESQGLLDLLGEFVLGAVCKEIASLEGALVEGASVSVNISPFELKAGFSAKVVDQVMSFGIDPSMVKFELTEEIMAPGCVSGSSLHCLVDAGFKLAIDDFGSGYSSLGRLGEYPFTQLKLDKSLLKNIRQSRVRRGIFEAVVSMAAGLGMETVAEGVETVDELNYVSSCGVSIVQGFLFGPPLPAIRMRKLLTNRAGSDLFWNPCVEGDRSSTGRWTTSVQSMFV